MTNIFVRALIPVIRRHYLFAFAGILWTIAGGILCVRGTIWMAMLPVSTGSIVVLVSVIVAGAGYIFGFSKIVGKNIDRIHRLPERANIFAFTAARGYVMIGFMMALGITLRNSSIPKYYLTIPYFVMGSMLLLGSVRFYRQFVAFAVKDQLEDV
ncbi:MAG: hypothetical protein WBW71_08385 [Bacteroidota bacterium]